MAEIDETQFSLMSLEDELTCSICLSTFDCPVTIPCGHNFCQDCLLATWKDTYSCPQCLTHFATKPELKKNTVLSTVVQTFNLRSSKSESNLFGEEKKAEEKDVIRCDTCMEAEASQTCLTCMASFCEEHLRPHRENPNFAVHQLSEPVGDLSERICPDHHKLMELFCSQHGRPICSLCLQNVHKGCSFTSLEEQRTLKESELQEKLGLLDRKIEKTETVLFQMNDVQSKLKEGAAKRKTALAAMYQQMRDMLAQEEREAQNEVDRELELGQTKLRDITKKLTDKSAMMRKARGDIDGLLSQPQTTAFLQASYDLLWVVNFEPYTPRINLDSKKVTATQAFAGALKEYLTDTFKQPVEARLPLIKPGDKANPVSGPADTERTGSQTESERPQPPEQIKQPQSLGCPPVQQFFQPVHVPYFSHMGSQAGWNSQYSFGMPPVTQRGPPFMGGQKKQQDKKQPSTPGRSNPGTPRPDFTKKDNPKSHPPSGKSTQHHPPSEKSTKHHPPSDKSTKHHPRPKKNN
ncbi:E3 ubiquitin/ISG15 ligase TRIM25-like isoform X2 [Toxotes jaculatrix]|uniref:E3 ubiquitin/ISG15 ligase TRIM25-like isoform X2 n=1 Tax=Toxotes jaculatrix TaxID=941984 RepID=UPI001B3AC7B8|nr:E3 ubiquitin/ISG15 ligase TRIM25-like isoform X2 [Toxotes jaculatrix]